MGITLPTPTILANVAKIGDTEYASLESAVAAAQKAGSGVIELLFAYDRYPQAWVTPCVIDAPETMTSSYTFHAFNPENGDEALAVAYNSDPSALTTGQQKRAQEVLNQVGNFSNWNADFEVSFDADMTAEDFSIGGQYGNISWIDGLSANLTGNTPMRLLGSVGMSFTYEYMMMDVFQFNCGITGKNMSKLAGHTFSVDLCMYDPNNENVKILIGTTKYTFPAVNVAKIDTTEYTSLADAIAAVPTDGTEPTTFTMIADEAIVGNAGVTVVKGQNIVLDLNGKTVSNLVNESKASQIITNYGTLTITGNGTMTNALTDGTIAGDWPTYNYVTNLISNLGTLTIENGTFDNTQDSGITYALDNNSNGVPAIATINGGTFISAGNSAVRMFCNSTTAANTLTINDGYFAGNYYAVSVSNASGATKVGTLNINGGEFESIADEYNACVANWESNKSSNIAVNITGGKFNDYVLIASNPAITGGLYKYDKYTDPDDGTVYDLHSYPAEGYEVIANTDEATKEAYP
ncbi:MAG: hypothetical protein KBS47_06530 [Bacteroidales bacterium]|nr:hypothetical protein [Candidatus Equimonas enterica]